MNVSCSQLGAHANRIDGKKHAFYDNNNYASDIDAKLSLFHLINSPLQKQCRPPTLIVRLCICIVIAAPLQIWLWYDLCWQCYFFITPVVTFTQIPYSMAGTDGSELVLDACPRLTYLSFPFRSDSCVITLLALDVPSLESLEIGRCTSLETLRLTCPNLVRLGISMCPKMSLT